MVEIKNDVKWLKKNAERRDLECDKCKADIKELQEFKTRASVYGIVGGAVIAFVSAVVSAVVAGLLYAWLAGV